MKVVKMRRGSSIVIVPFLEDGTVGFGPKKTIFSGEIIFSGSGTPIRAPSTNTTSRGGLLREMLLPWTDLQLAVRWLQ